MKAENSATRGWSGIRGGKKRTGEWNPGPERQVSRWVRGQSRCLQSSRRWAWGFHSAQGWSHSQPRRRTGNSRAARVEAFGPPEGRSGPATMAGEGGPLRRSVQAVSALAEISEARLLCSPGTELEPSPPTPLPVRPSPPAPGEGRPRPAGENGESGRGERAMGTQGDALGSQGRVPGTSSGTPAQRGV